MRPGHRWFGDSVTTDADGCPLRSRMRVAPQLCCGDVIPVCPIPVVIRFWPRLSAPWRSRRWFSSASGYAGALLCGRFRMPSACGHACVPISVAISGWHPHVVPSRRIDTSRCGHFPNHRRWDPPSVGGLGMAVIRGRPYRHWRYRCVIAVSYMNFFVT